GPAPGAADQPARRRAARPQQRTGRPARRSPPSGTTWPLSGMVLLVSGRASFELVQKAVMGGIPVLAAVSAPSSAAAELAADTGLTLVGFLRGGSMNVCTGEHRVAAAGG